MNRLALLRAASLPFESLADLGGGPLSDATRDWQFASAALAKHAASLAGPMFDAAGPPVEDAGATRARFALLRLQRAVHAHRQVRDDDVQQAAPLLPPPLRAALSEYEILFDRTGEAEARCHALYPSAFDGAHRALCAIAGSPLVEHGMELASRSLVPKVRRISACSPSTWRHADRHTAAKAAAYVVRMTTKTSPNGVFCAVAPAWVGGSEASVAGTGGVTGTDVLLSLSEVRKVTACLAADPAVQDIVIPRVNPTLREVAEEWSWWRPATLRDPNDDEIHSRAKDQPVLRAFIEEATRGAHTTGALVRAVSERTHRDEDELRAFFGRLVETGILIAELEVPWSSRRRFRDLAALARRRGARADWIASLERIEAGVDRLGGLAFEARATAMERIVRDVAELPRRRPFRADELFRVDSVTALDVRLPQSVFDDLRQAMARFTPLLAALYPAEAQHSRLIRRFLQHQPAEVDVPFLEVYSTLAEPSPAEGGRAGPMEFLDPGPEAMPPARRVFDWFVKRAAAAGPGETVEVDLEAEAEQPWNAGVLFQVAARSAGDVAAGRYTIALNGVYNGVGLALSRFAHLLRTGESDSAGRSQGPVVDELRRAWSTAARRGAVHAELTYNHEARTANAGLRPVLFDHEIELLGELASERVRSVPLSDLVIRYDTQEDRLVLRSASAGIEIVPVLTSGVSPAGIVSSLIHIGRQGFQPVGWLPGFRAPGIRRWPRFRCGRVVLFRERWVFAGPELPRADGTEAAWYLTVARWREAHELPRHVFVHTSVETKPFYVDLESPVMVDLFRRAIETVVKADDERLVVTEMLPGPDELWVRDSKGSYATEFLLQMEGAGGARVVAEPQAVTAGSAPG